MAYDYSFLFSSMNSTGSTSWTSFDYTTLSSIKNGSYKKLLNAYYKKQSTDGSASSSSVKGDKKSSAEKVNAASVRDQAADVSDSVDSINKASLWNRTEKTDESGNKTKEYNTDAIYKAVKTYVDDYNALVKSTGNSNDNSVLRTAANMVNSTKANKDILAKVGISIGKDNKLSIDEDAFKKAEMTTVKSIFTGAGSYGRTVQANASMIYGSAVSQLARISGSSTYGSTGSYSYISSSDFNRYL